MRARHHASTRDIDAVAATVTGTSVHARTMPYCATRNESCIAYGQFFEFVCVMYWERKPEVSPMQSEQRFAPQVVEVLKESGWFEGRNTEGFLRLPDGFKMFPAAGRVLVEFGGLKGGQVRAGITMAASDFDLRPELAQGESDRFQEFEKKLGVRLYPLGEAHRGHCFLVIDENGRVYAAMDDIAVLGENFEAGIENLILGRSA
jgi:hypothetical protein